MISYLGGKSRIGKWIKEFIPNDIEIYAEPFSGMFWTYFCIELENYDSLKKVVYNDFNSLNSNLFACAVKYEEFNIYLKDQDCQKKGKSASLNQSKMFYEYQKEIFSNLPKLDVINPNFEYGVKYSYVLSQIFSGSRPETSKFIDLKGKYHSKFDSFRRKINFTNNGLKLKSHLDMITDIENDDFERLMTKYDSIKTFYYLDPPYYNCESYYSAHDFGIEDHERLSKCLKNLKSRWALSYYFFPQLLEWFPKDKYRWVEKNFTKASGASKGKKQSTGTELLIMNF